MMMKDDNATSINTKHLLPSHSSSLYINETTKSYYNCWNINRKMFHTTTTTTTSALNKLSVAIVGSGPSGFYSAKYLQLAMERAKDKEKAKTSSDNDDDSTINTINQLHVDLIDRLPTPYGLVRSGVAPDHPEVKNIENDFISVIKSHNQKKHNNKNNDDDDENEDDKKIQTLMGFRGNVHIGKDISLQELRDLYDVVILAYGCESDKKLGIEVERKKNNHQNHNDDDNDNDGDMPVQNLDGIYSAREFVAWYNGHPDFVHFGNLFQKALKDDHPEDAQVVVIGQGKLP